MYAGRWARWSGRVVAIVLPRSGIPEIVIHMANKSCPLSGCVLLQFRPSASAKIESVMENDTLEYEGRIQDALTAETDVWDRVILTDVTIISRSPGAPAAR
jgi:hypothetical protein